MADAQASGACGSNTVWVQVPSSAFFYTIVFFHIKEVCVAMADKKNVVTYAGLKKIEEELQDLKVNKRREIAAKIKEAREQGDLSENAEYDAAKDEQRDIEARIEQLEAMLKNIEVVDEDEVDTGVVGIGCKVTVYDYEFDEEVTYDVVGSSQADIMNNKISDESPVGMALKGAKVGDEVMVEAPDGAFKYKVIDIKRQEL